MRDGGPGGDRKIGLGIDFHISWCFTGPGGGDGSRGQSLGLLDLVGERDFGGGGCSATTLANRSTITSSLRTGLSSRPAAALAPVDVHRESCPCFMDPSIFAPFY